jgi:hypothetical protein
MRIMTRIILVQVRINWRNVLKLLMTFGFLKGGEILVNLKDYFILGRLCTWELVR